MLSASKTSGPSGYNLTNSLRFRRSASAYLNRTPASAGNRQIWTWSAWVKRGDLTNTNTLFSGYTNDSNRDETEFNGTTLSISSISGGAVACNLITTQVFRDPSAWYHIVYSVDTTQATASNRIKVYVNGNQVTSFGTSTYPAQNFNFFFNNNNANYIGCYGYSTLGGYYDGYMTEINFIDGQALTPSSFGSTNATTGVWQPAKYTGTYGTNGFYLPFTNYTSSVYAGYSANMSANYNTLPTSGIGTNFQFTGNFTIEGWVLYPTASVDSSMYVIGDGSTYLALNIDMSTGVYNIYCNSGTPSGSFTSNIPLNNWTHVAMVRNGSTITLYTNGVAKGTITSAGTLGYTSPTINRFGGASTAARYMSNVRITKSAVYTANFIPPAASLTNIANTIVLTYQNSSAIDNSSNAWTMGTVGSMSFPGGNVIFNADIFSDRSGNANSWTPNNINYSFYGTTYDSMTDVPTLTSATVANYAVLNPLVTPSTTTIINGNLGLSGYTGSSSVNSTMGVSSGKWYWEAINYTDFLAGVCSVPIGSYFPGQSGRTDNSCGWNSAFALNTTNTYVTGSISKYGTLSGSAAANGDIIGFALDMDAGNLYYYVNGTVTNSGNPVFTGITGTVFPSARNGSATNSSFNFGQQPFTYTPPTGYLALNTYNLPTSTIVQGNKYMDATLYTGTGSALNVINAGSMQPDLLWTKSRSAATDNYLFDSIRGTGSILISNSTAAETVLGPQMSFNSNGFTVGGLAAMNTNGATYVGWQWQAGKGSTSSNTSGSITSTVSVNASAGFSIVTYTGTGANATVGHGLGVAPKLIIEKVRTVGTGWCVYHTSLGATQLMELNTTGTPFTSSTYWQNTSPTSSVFSIGTYGGVNTNGGTHVAYCWAEISGFSKFGSYTGNSSTDGPFIYLGFRPKFVIFKDYSNAHGWVMVDSSRNTYNVAGDYVWANSSNQEDSPYSVANNTAVDFLSNGFKLRNAAVNSGENNGSSNYLYMAWAESPFRNSLAR